MSFVGCWCRFVVVRVVSSVRLGLVGGFVLGAVLLGFGEFRCFVLGLGSLVESFRR